MPMAAKAQVITALPGRRDELAARIDAGRISEISASRQLSQALDELRRAGKISYAAPAGSTIGEWRLAP